MLERADDPRYQAIAEPNAHALTVLGMVLDHTAEPTICEVGVGIGATSARLCERLAGRGVVHFYDFAEKLADLAADLAARGWDNTLFFGNTRKRYDSYNWSLLNNHRALLAGDTRYLYDFVFLDGAHAFHHDAPATVLLKEMLRPGGIFLFDDYDWSFAVSPTMNPGVNPSIREDYTDEQIEESHVALVCAAFMDPDARFEVLDIGFRPGSEHRRAYRRLR